MAEKGAHNGVQRSTSFSLEAEDFIYTSEMLERFLSKVSSVWRMDLRDYKLPIPMMRSDRDTLLNSPRRKGNDSIYLLVKGDERFPEGLFNIYGRYS